MKVILCVDSSVDNPAAQGDHQEPEPPSPASCPVPPVLVQSALSAAESVIEAELLDLAPELAACEAVEISLVFSDADGIREINRDYREIDEPTDVLSFPMWEEDGKFLPDIDASPVLPLGDIVICMDEAVKRNEGMTEDEVLCLMLAHSLLHLLAWDHDTDERRDAMWARQDKIKEKLCTALRRESE